MNLSLAGLDLIKSYESCRLNAYQDSGGVWTIGWGHTGPDVTKDSEWTQQEADWCLLQDVSGTIVEVNRMVKVPLTQDQFDALVDFAYNVGDGALEGSTLLRMLNSGNYSGAAEEFEKWDHVHGMVIAGLLRRRMQEEQMFKTEET